MDDHTLDQHPVAIIEDRYGGAYSGGGWIAVSVADSLHELGDGSRADFILNDGPSLGDSEAAAFWDNAPDWVAVGNTPDEAVANLYAGVKATGR